MQLPRSEIRKRPFKATALISPEQTKDDRLFSIEGTVAPYLPQMMRSFNEQPTQTAADVSVHLSYADSLFTLFPHLRRECGFEQQTVEVLALRDQARSFYNSIHRDQLGAKLYAAACFFRLFPQSKQILTLPDNFFSISKRIIIEHIHKEEMPDALLQLEYVSILYPDKQHEFHSAEIESEVATVIQSDQRPIPRSVAARLLLFFPTLKPLVTERYDMAEGMRTLQRRVEHQKWNLFAQVAVDLAMITTDHLTIDTTGIHLNNQRAPEVRKSLPQRSIV